jgi:hypothetical protein
MRVGMLANLVVVVHPKLLYILLMVRVGRLLFIKLIPPNFMTKPTTHNKKSQHLK